MLWIALLVAVCNAIAPTLLSIAAVARGESVVEICTAFGIKRVPPASQSGGPPPASADSTACKFCLGSQSPCAPAIAQLEFRTDAPEPESVSRPDDPPLTNPSRFFSRPRGPPSAA